MPEMTLFEAIRTLRAVCEFTAEPVSDEALRTILDLAVCAPSGGKRQSWEFIVMRDPATRRAIQDYYWQVFLHAMRPRPSRDGPSGPQAQVERWQQGHPDHYAENLHRIPVFLLVCFDRQRLGIPGNVRSSPCWGFPTESRRWLGSPLGIPLGKMAHPPAARLLFH